MTSSATSRNPLDSIHPKTLRHATLFATLTKFSSDVVKLVSKYDLPAPQDYAVFINDYSAKGDARSCKDLEKLHQKHPKKNDKNKYEIEKFAAETVTNGHILALACLIDLGLMKPYEIFVTEGYISGTTINTIIHTCLVNLAIREYMPGMVFMLFELYKKEEMAIELFSAIETGDTVLARYVLQQEDKSYAQSIAEKACYEIISDSPSHLGTIRQQNIIFMLQEFTSRDPKEFLKTPAEVAEYQRIQHSFQPIDDELQHLKNRIINILYTGINKLVLFNSKNQREQAVVQAIKNCISIKEVERVIQNQIHLFEGNITQVQSWPFRKKIGRVVALSDLLGIEGISGNTIEFYDDEEKPRWQTKYALRWELQLKNKPENLEKCGFYQRLKQVVPMLAEYITGDEREYMKISYKKP